MSKKIDNFVTGVAKSVSITFGIIFGKVLATYQDVLKEQVKLIDNVFNELTKIVDVKGRRRS